LGGWGFGWIGVIGVSLVELLEYLFLAAMAEVVFEGD
jgi:hypothetical protein